MNAADCHGRGERPDEQAHPSALGSRSAPVAEVRPDEVSSLSTPPEGSVVVSSAAVEPPWEVDVVPGTGGVPTVTVISSALVLRS